MTDSLRDYAAQLAGLYERNGQTQNPYRLLVDHGTEAEFTPLPEGEEPGQAKGCYQNAGQRILFADLTGNDAEGLTYYEGLCATGDGLGFPIEHAWCQDADGRVYEMTLRHEDDRCGFCLGEGEFHPSEHWDANPGDWEEIEDEEATVACEFCNGTGKGESRSLAGTTYLGVPIATEDLRGIVVKTGVWGALFTRPDLVAETLEETR